MSSPLLLLALCCLSLCSTLAPSVPVPAPKPDIGSTCSDFSVTPIPCTFIVVLASLAGLALLARITVGVLSCFRTAGLTVDLQRVQGVLASHKFDQTAGSEVTGLVSSERGIEFSGVLASVPSHHLGTYNYVLDCLNSTGTVHKAFILFGLHYTSLVWFAVAATELGSVVLIAIALSQQFGKGWVIAGLVIASIWILIYLYVFIHMLVVSSRDYWVCSFHFPFCSDLFDRSNKFVTLSADEVAAVAVSNRGYITGAAASVTTAKLKLMCYNDYWIREHNYLPQVLAFHRLGFYTTTVMALSFDPPVIPASAVWVALYLVIFFLYYYFRNRC